MADPLSIAASVVTVAVPALHGTRFLLDDLQKLKDAPKTVRALEEDVHSVGVALTTLQRVEDREWQSLGISVAEELKTMISICMKACDQFRVNLQYWIRHSEDEKLATKDRANVGFFQIKEYRSSSETASSRSIPSYGSIRHTHITEEIKKTIATKQTEIKGAITTADKQLIVLESRLGELSLNSDDPEATRSTGSNAEALQQLEEERKALNASRKVLDELLSKSKEEAVAKAAAENQSRSPTTMTFGNENSGFQAGSISGPVSGITFGRK